MKIGLFAINYGTCADPEVAVRVARHAEDAGLESVWTGEHLVLPDPAPPGFGLPPTTPLLDTIAALTLVAARTSTIKVASGIIVLPLRNPVVLAKELASVDVVSQGRLIAGVGAGYVAAEFAAAGVPMRGRGARMDEYIRALSAWLSNTRSSASTVSSCCPSRTPTGRSGMLRFRPTRSCATSTPWPTGSSRNCRDESATAEEGQWLSDFSW